MTIKGPPPTYNEARAAKRVIEMARLDPFRVGEAELAKAQAVRAARSQYLSDCHKASPKYRPKYTKQLAKLATTDPVQWALLEGLRHVRFLRLVGSPKAHEALREIESATCF